MLGVCIQWCEAQVDTVINSFQTTQAWVGWGEVEG